MYENISRQFEAAISMLENALIACPEELWTSRLWIKPSEPSGFSEFWYLAYHTLFWLDFYLSGSREGFAPPTPFTLDELEAGLLPERPYTKDELKTYLDYGREKCRATFESMTDETAGRLCSFPWGELGFAELQLYNMRHVQEHASQLNLFLGQQTVAAPGWVTGVRRPQSGG